MNDQLPKILILDSGLGGLTIYQSIRALIPNLPVIYCCDFEAFPYGIKSDQFILKRIIYLLDAFFSHYCIDLVVIACNTASTLVLEQVRQLYSVPFVGVVPAIKLATSLVPEKKIGLLATPATLRRHYVKNLIAQFSPHNEVLLVSSQDLVVHIEKFMRGENFDQVYLETILLPFINLINNKDLLPQEELGALVLGCTHFPLVADKIAQCLPAVLLVDSGQAIAKRVKHLLLTQLENSEQNVSSAFSNKKQSGNIFIYTGSKIDSNILLNWLFVLGFEHFGALADIRQHT